VTGRASVIDGDALEIHGERIRLSGIDAPESAQLCKDDRAAITDVVLKRHKNSKTSSPSLAQRAANLLNGTTSAGSLLIATAPMART
jgi:endonuclease YncB( thermonuclease family)